MKRARAVKFPYYLYGLIMPMKKGAGDVLKFGFSKKPIHRWDSLFNMLPFPSLIRYVPAGGKETTFTFEKFVHEQLQEHRTHREWFYFDGDAEIGFDTVSEIYERIYGVQADWFEGRPENKSKLLEAEKSGRLYQPFKPAFSRCESFRRMGAEINTGQSDEVLFQKYDPSTPRCEQCGSDMTEDWGWCSQRCFSEWAMSKGIELRNRKVPVLTKRSKLCKNTIVD